MLEHDIWTIENGRLGEWSYLEEVILRDVPVPAPLESRDDITGVLHDEVHIAQKRIEVLQGLIRERERVKRFTLDTILSNESRINSVLVNLRFLQPYYILSTADVTRIQTALADLNRQRQVEALSSWEHVGPLLLQLLEASKEFTWAVRRQRLLTDITLENGLGH